MQINTLRNKIILPAALIWALLLALTLAPPIWAEEPRSDVYTVFSAEEVTAGSTATSAAYRLDSNVSGYFSLQVAVTGDGTCKFEYLLSNDDSNYLEPSSATDIAAGITKTSGPGSDGKDIYSFEPPPAKFIKIKITETGGGNTVTVTGYLLIQ